MWGQLPQALWPAGVSVSGSGGLVGILSLGREVVGSPPRDQPSQLLLIPTCQRSLVTEPSTLQEASPMGRGALGGAGKVASPGLQTLSRPLPLVTFKPCPSPTSPCPSPCDLGVSRMSSTECSQDTESGYMPAHDSC